jgi:uncharacterized GH25 family protein
MKNTHLTVFCLLIVAAAQTVRADIDFDELSVEMTDDSLNAGDAIEIKMILGNPDSSGSASFELKIDIDGVTVYDNEDYTASFTDGQDKTITIGSGSFPGKDLDNNAWKDNLMNRICGNHDVTVTISGSDLVNDFDASTDFTIGEDYEDPSIEIDPDSPDVDEDVTVRIKDENDDDLKGAKVKVTWIDDPDGNKEGEWDSKDKSWSHDTDDNGEVNFNIGDDFDNDAGGAFQVDAYATDYCLERGTITVGKKALDIEATPQEIRSGETVKICVTDSTEKKVSNAKVSITGPSYSKSSNTPTGGCLNMTLTTSGTYTLSASKSGYESVEDYHMTVGEKETTTTTTVKTTTTTTSTESTTTIKTTTTTIKTFDGKLSITAAKSSYYIGETASIAVKDQNQNPIGNADVTITPQNIKGTTDNTGTFTFALATSGTYNIRAEKSNYLPATQTIEAAAGPGTTQTGNQTAGNGESSGVMKTVGENKYVIGGALLVLTALAILAAILGVLLTTMILRKRKEAEAAQDRRPQSRFSRYPPQRGRL